MTELPPLTPQFVLVAAALLVFGVDTLLPDRDNNTLLAGIATAGTLLAAGTAAWFLSAGTGDAQFVQFDGAIIVDALSLFFVVVVGSVGTLVVMASHDYLDDADSVAEFYALTLLAATGMTLMAAANSLVTVFISLELASLPSYVLVSYLKRDRGSIEAGLKYFLIGALSSGVMLYGISLVYAATGVMGLPAIADTITAGTDFVGVLGLGIVMLVAGFAFKTASVPFHFWAPEAYEGAPAPVSAFISSASKAAGFAVLFRVFTTAFPLDVIAGTVIDWSLLFAALAVVTMTLGNFAAATQENVKRMLAYSSVGHAGYVLIGLAALQSGGGAQNSLVLGASMMHLLVYGFMNTGAFLFVALAEYWDVGRTFEDYNGLSKRAPVACVAMTVFMFSLAGLPVGAGFLSKYVLFAGAVQSGFAWLAGIAAINSALSLFYYSRVVKALWIEDPRDDLSLSGQPTGLYVAVLAAAVGTIALLVAFDPVAQTATHAADVLFAG
ncbi:NADH-quinone oxidoreductase subunit N [Halobacterium salinarum]|uniref:NADH dehydrogenase-like complex subunit N n=5 Tax=Halobacterium salinarum TaxID=2242 RepID=A0A510N6I6_HALSA|nr:NADH-quinone oxidoreductase subunit N [Halobacterium salinarum]MBB6089989.1 NADH-quinone oxidoreductase subunit N [Halobacterium salinarum]MDL0120705.1 NADH-quinone oxidoreductase subunit N [Halobacterium salinarum]MDL0123938.1 NADH-quinone oxidoreductase subunit N [Halobacterium salinarum]MDL0130582.1 NADH-quinone oxidoreductase subunit N [Halobacterium salinarum]MDL0135912.1 NADH-quinone oxidoreductase subunit N [Halobacterium salinarum]